MEESQVILTLAQRIGANTLQQQLRFLSHVSGDALPGFASTQVFSDEGIAYYIRELFSIFHFTVYIYISLFSQKQAFWAFWANLFGHRSFIQIKRPKRFLLTFIYTQEITACLNKTIPTLVNHSSTPEEQEPGAGLDAGSHDSDRDHQLPPLDPSIEAAIENMRSRVDTFDLPDKLHFVAHMNRDARPKICISATGLDARAKGIYL